MRYYHPFPEAIPLSKAGCSRVTHPSATKNLNYKPKFSVRLACVKRAASVRPEPGSNSFFNSISISFRLMKSILFITLALLLRIFSIFAWFFFLVSSKEFQGSLLFFLALFNFQDAVEPTITRLVHYITFYWICQPLFQSFFKFFFVISAYSSWVSFSIISLPVAFVKYFFKISSKTFSGTSFRCRRSLFSLRSRPASSRSYTFTWPPLPTAFLL